MKTIAIPVYNEEKSIEKTICSITPQINKEDEIFVVASGCTDKTIPILKRLSKKDRRVKILIQKNREGKASAINLIFKKSKGSIIIFTDGDVLLDKNAIKNLIKKMNKDIGAISGRNMPYKEDNFFDKLQSFSWKILNNKKIKEQKKEKFFALNGYLFALKKGIINHLDTKNLIEDALIGWKIRKKGYSTIYEPNAKVYIKAPQNLKDYLNQKKRIRLGWWQMTKQGVNPVKNENKGFIKYLFTDLYAWPYLFLELYCIIASYIDFKRRKIYWKQIKSSKI